MQGFGAQTHCFLRSPGPNNLSEQKEVSNGPQKVTDPIFVNPPPEGLLNNAKLYEQFDKESDPGRVVSCNSYN